MRAEGGQLEVCSLSKLSDGFVDAAGLVVLTIPNHQLSTTQSAHNGPSHHRHRGHFSLSNVELLAHY